MESAISPTRQADFPEWYQQVVKAADLAEVSAVRGCMVIKPWGYGIWENIQRGLDERIKATGHENAYFPLFVPLSFLEKEAQHVEGFAKECAVVTHHRLESKDGKLVPAGVLEEPLIVRPTSEMIIGESFSRWIQSHRDLPMLINQWANVVRWEMRTRVFLRTAEFLWQEGHTAHATQQEAEEETLKMLEVYRSFGEEQLALPFVTGEKPAHERFPGADRSFTIEAVMQDGKALQAGTSHYLGQNFSKAMNIKFVDDAQQIRYAYTTSWGVSTRLIGALIMTHADDDGMRVPPRVAPYHAVVLPAGVKPETEAQVMAYCNQVTNEIRGISYGGRSLSVKLDKREIRGGDKMWEWVKKGCPVRIECGPRDIAADQVSIQRRDKPHKERIAVARKDLATQLPKILDEIQSEYLRQATELRNSKLRSDITDFESFSRFFTPKNTERPEIHGGFVQAPWCGDADSLEKLDPLKVTVRCIPMGVSSVRPKCVITGRPAKMEVIFAKAY